MDGASKFSYLREYLEKEYISSATHRPTKDTNLPLPRYQIGLVIKSKILCHSSLHCYSYLFIQRCNGDKRVRTLHDGTIASIRALEAQGLQSEIYYQFYKSMLLKKLPTDLIVEWRSRSETETNTVLDLLAFVETEVKNKELLNFARKPPSFHLSTQL